MNYALYAILPFISGAIGWFTNYVAIKMLFHPRKPKKILFMTFHGIFPKRKPTLAKRLGRAVAKDLLSVEVLKNKIDTEENRSKLKETISNEFEVYIKEKFASGNPILSMLAKGSMSKQLVEKVRTMLDELIPKLMDQITGKIQDANIEETVEERVLQFSDQKFENLLMSVIKKELKFIEIAGAILGFVIGVFQVALVIVTQEIL